MSVEVPGEVRTERLVIRPVEAADAAAFLTWRSRPEVVKYMYQAPWTPELAEQKLATWSETRSFEKDGDAIQFAVARAESPGRLIGELMLKRAAGEGQAEVGWTFHPDVHGRGLATEAAAALLRLAFGHFGFHRVMARVDAENEASARLCARLGLRLEARLVENDKRLGEDAWASELDFAILDREFAAQSAV